jgi:peptidyl-prolyl cis-trans isomerase SurA
MGRKLACLLLLIPLLVQSQDRIKVDGVAVVVGKNIVLHSDIDKFKLELEQRIEGKIDISDCELLEEIMKQKLLAHHAVVDSIVASDAEVNAQVDRNIAFFSNQLGSLDEVIKYYGFSDEDDLRSELYNIQKEQLLIQKERASITEDIDVTPEEVRTFFKNLSDSGDLPEFSAEIELAQIVRYLKPTEEETERVIDKLNEIKKDIENGFSFRLKALINSDDPAVSSNGPGAGGKYTLTRESGFIKEFKEVAFSLEEGEISEPFESGFGFHIIQVEKIRGQERDVRHILIQPEISDAEIQAAGEELAGVRSNILSGEMTFEEAVLMYSEDTETKSNGGLIINPASNDSKFDLTLMDPRMYGGVSNLKAGEITEPFLEQPRGEAKMFKIILLKSKVEGHVADFTSDYEKIQQLTLQKKQDESIEAWVKEKISDTYIKINEEFKSCGFENNWKKE